MPGSPDGPLFAPPGARDVLEKSDAEKLSEDIAMLTRAVYALADRSDRARQNARSGQST